MAENEEQAPIDVRALAKKKYENYIQQKKAYEEMQRLGITDDQLEKQGNDRTNQKKILTELTMKIAERFEKEMEQQHQGDKKKVNKDGIQLEQKISKEIENCTCPICYELMVPPLNSPILIFPCGHTFCKQCLIPKDKPKLSKCPFCRKPFQSYAVNIHLQNIICAYTDNKHLIEKYNQQEQIDNNKVETKQVEEATPTIYSKNYDMFALRCQILEQEKDEVLNQLKKKKDEVDSHSAVINQMQNQRNEVIKKLAQLQKELDLIDSFIGENQDLKQKAQQQISQANEKLALLDQTLLPLKQEKNKYAILSSNQKK